MKIVSLKDLPETTTSHNATGKKRVMIGKDQINFLLQFAQVAFKPGEVASEHTHNDMYEVFLVESGSGIIRINDKKYPLEKGTCVTVEPGELHEVTNTGAEDLVLTYFEIDDKAGNG